MDPSKKFIETVIRKAGKEVMKQFGKSTISKIKSHESDFVTTADLAANKIIIESINKSFPKHKIISEETKNDVKVNEDNVWIIDPIDGTYPFSKGLPLFGIMIAYAKKGVLEKAAIYLPYFNDLYYAEKDKGAFKNNKKITCSKNPNLEFSVGIGYGFPEGVEEKATRKFIEIEKTTNYCMMNCYSQAINSAYVAEGKCAWFFCPDPCGGIWDLAPPVLILKESGCVVTDFNGKPWTINTSRGFIAANNSVHQKIMKIIQS